MPHKKCFSNTSPLCTSKIVTNPRILADKNRLIFLNIHELTLIWFCWHIHIHKLSLLCRCLSFGSVFFLFFNSLASFNQLEWLGCIWGLTFDKKCSRMWQLKYTSLTNSFICSLVTLIQSKSILSYKVFTIKMW